MEPLGETPPAGAETDRRHLVVPLRWLAVGVLVAVLAGLAGWLGLAAFEHHRKNVASALALDAATGYTAELANIDFNTVDTSLQDLRGHTTEKLNAMHAKDGERIRKIVVDRKVTARGDIVEATVVSATTEKVTVVLVVDQMVADVDNPEPDVERNRVTITMDNVDGRWLASDVKL